VSVYLYSAHLKLLLANYR